MKTGSSATKWQDIGWDGVFLQLPESWQPTVIYQAYLFFQQEGKSVLEIKWQQIHGRFSTEKIFDQIRNALRNGSRLQSWDIPSGLQHLLASHTVSGFQLLHENSCSHGLILFCPACKRVTLLQWYFDTVREEKQLAHILGSFRDHSQGSEQVWSVYDIRACLPVEAKLRSHEFLPGRYTLCFDLGATALTLYRFKPAAVLLHNTTIGEFGKSLMNRTPREEGNGWASWLYSAEGLELLQTKARRHPVWQWMRLWHDPEHNVILGVKAEGNRLTKTGWLEKICKHFIPIESQQDIRFIFSRADKTTSSVKSDAGTRDHALECVPVKNPQITQQQNDNGNLDLTYQVRIRPWFQNIVQKISGRGDDIIERKLQLDVLGATVWDMIDGRRKAWEIIDEFQAMHQLNRREAELSVTIFFKELGKRGLIVMREGE